ncbi:hypothetical protein [Chitinolyticbacter meiyuanensis]|uniref:hypothetical protein n=1 Tax=Chitinolyticbacter meiyuanensis TaxID=682798 RepID=UPI00165231F4|nr:hypothetical protein [Chitinolyticbacter meiyuanensis]
MGPQELLVLLEQCQTLFSRLSTPATLTADVAWFCSVLSHDPPVYLYCLPEPWSRLDCCSRNVGEFIKARGGRMLCGYRVLLNERVYLEGIRHAIWTDGTEMRDVSFLETGEPRILFVPDSCAFDAVRRRVRFAQQAADKALLEQYEALEYLLPQATVSDDVAWHSMQTYAQWQASRHKPSPFHR